MGNIKKKISLLSIMFFSVSLFTASGTNIAYADACVNEEETDRKAGDLSKVRDVLNHTQNNADENEEEVSLLIELEDGTNAFCEDNIKEAEEKEEDTLKSQQGIIKEVEDITGNKVKKTFGYLVNGFSITGKASDVLKIDKIKGVKSVSIDKGSKSNMASAKVTEEADKVLETCGYDGKGIVVAVIDTGIDPDNKDFQEFDESRMKITQYDAQNLINTLGHGTYINDKIPYAYNYVSESNDVYCEDQYHGMHVSGIIAANGGIDSKNSVVGVAKNAQILALRASNSEGSFHDEDIIEAIEDAVKLGADVINISIGANKTKSATSENLLNKAIDSAAKKGVLCVKAAGNEQNSASTDIDSEPTNKYNLKDTGTISKVSDYAFLAASLENTNVIYTDKSTGEKVQVPNNEAGRISNFSSFGPTADLELAPEITAPGGKIYSTINNNQYAACSGTSMAAPNVTGGEALIVQSLKERNINLSGEELVRFLKNTIMNTAEPVMESSDIPYSPRRQGAGEMKLSKAVKNNVIATDSRGKASLALKNIGNKTAFTINLKNYGSENVTYKLSNSPLYSETVSDNLIKEYKIQNSSISFNQDIVTVPAMGNASVSGTVNVSNLNLQNFVEGFVSLKSLDGENPDLSIPVLGFYGNFDNEKIIDSPIYSDDSKTKITGLGETAPNYGFDYYGEDKDGNVNANNVSFSPGLSKSENGKDKDDESLDGYKDTVAANAYFLRSAKEYNLQVLDSNKNFVTKNVTFDATVKDTVCTGDIGSINNLLYDYTWDGKRYNQTTGKYELMPDGQYYIRMTTKGFVDSTKVQTIDLPVKLDTKKPEINVKSVVYRNGGYDITWTAQDSNSGLEQSAAVYVIGDESSYKQITDITENNGTFTGRYDYDYVDSGVFDVYMSDNAGNMGEGIYNIFDEYDSVFFWNFNDNERTTSSTFMVGGDIASAVSRVTVNGNDASIEYGEGGSHTFVGQAYLSYGDNNVTINLYDDDGQVIKSVTKNIILDDEKPIIESVSPVNGKINSYYVTEDDSINLDVNVSDDSEVCGIIYNKATYLQSNITKAENGKIPFECKLEDGFNEIILSVYDKLNNFETKVINVIKVSDKDKLNIGFSNIKEEKNISKSLCENDVFTVKGYATQTGLNVLINGKTAVLGTDGIYTCDLKLNSGKNIINIKAVDSLGNTVAERTNKIYYSNKQPQISIDNLKEAGSNGIINTNSSKYKITGSASGFLYDYYLCINDNEVFRTNNEAVSSDNDLKRNFDYTVNLNKGENIIKVSVKDDYGNEAEKELKINCTDPNADTGDSKKSALLTILLIISAGFIGINKYKKINFN